MRATHFSSRQIENGSPGIAREEKARDRVMTFIFR
jgi:hypothetical protein